ncbi:hypothetical protein L2D01_09785 [Hyphomonadaceae bacterium ML37]|nr:hypothetical protein L2D01_09785 [Hyphomonadaceae bacterium ML37]
MTRSTPDPKLGASAPDAAAREARLAEALRANLKRRKAPRGAADGPGTDSGEADTG